MPAFIPLPDFLTNPPTMRNLFPTSGPRPATFLAALGLAVALFPTPATAQSAPAAQVAAARAGQSPLLSPWGGPHGGVPAFDKIQVADFKPALEAAMAENLAEVAAIANNPQAPTFENTLAALERSGHTLDRVQAAYGVWSSTLNDAAFGAVQTEMAPKLAAFNDQISQNTALFKRIAAVRNAPATKQLTPEQQRLVEVTYKQFVRAGAQLNAPARPGFRKSTKPWRGCSRGFRRTCWPMKAS